LQVIATPIGNLGDWTHRAAEAARAADLILCEDTRVTRVLLAQYGVATPTAAYHEHNAEAARPRYLAMLREGKTLALMSDAGTPLISDPGYKLVRAAQDAGIPVSPLPGASSLTAALSAAGLATDAFYFAGFLPPKSAARRAALAALSALPATLALLETAPRLTAALEDALAALGDREACVARELTKRFEELRRAPLSSLLAHYTATPPRGEIVLLIARAEARGGGAEEEAALDALLTRLLAEHRLREAVELACEQTGAARKHAYARALALTEESRREP
jgi:16S rRNA (cytidine1402-2'-O)-methyltransferase